MQFHTSYWNNIIYNEGCSFWWQLTGNSPSHFCNSRILYNISQKHSRGLNLKPLSPKTSTHQVRKAMLCMYPCEQMWYFPFTIMYLKFTISYLMVQRNLCKTLPPIDVCISVGKSRYSFDFHLWKWWFSLNTSTWLESWWLCWNVTLMSETEKWRTGSYDDQRSGEKKK